MKAEGITLYRQEKEWIKTAEGVHLLQEELEKTGNAIDDLNKKKIAIQVNDLDLGGIREEISQTATIASSMQSAIQGISFGGIKTQLKEISQLTSTLFDGFEPPDIQGLTRDIHGLGEEMKALQTYGFPTITGYGADLGGIIIPTAGGGDVYGITHAEDSTGAIINGGLTYGGTAITAMTGIASSLAMDLGTGILAPHIFFPLAILATILGAAQAVAGAKRNSENNAFSDYVSDQYDSAIQLSQQNLQLGRLLAKDTFALRVEGKIAEKQSESLAALGDAYHSEIKDQKLNLLNDLNGKAGEELNQLYEKAGQYEGIKESERTRIQRDVTNYILTGTALEGEYSEDERKQINQLLLRHNWSKSVVAAYENGEKLHGAKVSEEEYRRALATESALVENLPNILENLYQNSSIGQIDEQKNEMVINDIQFASKDSLYAAGYSAGENISEGIKDALLQDNFQVTGEVHFKVDPLPAPQAFTLEDEMEREGMEYKSLFNKKKSEEQDSKKEGISIRQATPKPYTLEDHIKNDSYVKTNHKAYGMDFVPYDGYTATLHWGERILTASENRQYSKNQAPFVSVNGPFFIREEADVDKVAMAIAKKIALYNEIM